MLFCSHFILITLYNGLFPIKNVTSAVVMGAIIGIEDDVTDVINVVPIQDSMRCSRPFQIQIVVLHNGVVVVLHYVGSNYGFR